MDDDLPMVPLLSRRKSIAGPFMRPSGAPTTTSSQNIPPSNNTTQVPPPLSRSHTHGSGWFSGFWNRTSNAETVSNASKTGPIPTLEKNETHTTLSHSYDEAVIPPKHNSRNSLYNSLGSPRTTNEDLGAVPNTSTSPPVTPRRLSESSMFNRPGIDGPGTDLSSEKPLVAAVDADVRQGPIETDLFWLVLRDIGE